MNTNFNYIKLILFLNQLFNLDLNVSFFFLIYLYIVHFSYNFFDGFII